MDLFLQLEKNVNPFPEYLKNLLHICGFSTKSLLSKLDLNDITSMEEFGQKTLASIAPATNEYFGGFETNIANFKILPGHKKLLFMAKEFLNSNDLYKRAIEEKNPTHKKFKHVSIIIEYSSRNSKIMMYNCYWSDKRTYNYKVEDGT